MKQAGAESMRAQTLAWASITVANAFLPLLMVPLLARRLGVEGVGVFLTALAFGYWISLLPEYGFQLSAPRFVAKHRADRERLRTYVGEVIAARLGLTGVALVLGAVLVAVTPILRAHLEIIPAMCLWAIAVGWAPWWFFQGMGKIRTLAFFELSTKGAALLAMYVWVRQADDLDLAMMLLAGTTALASTFEWLTVFRTIGLPSLPHGAMRAGLRHGGTLFLYRVGVSLYTTGNVAILGWLTNPALVGLYGASERIFQAAAAMFWPFWRTLHPYFSRMASHSNVRYRKALWLGSLATLGVGVSLLLVSWVGAPWAISLLFGDAFEASTPILMILALGLPAMALSGFWSQAGLIPLGADRTFLLATLLAAAVNLVLILVLVPRYGAEGMAMSVVAAEWVVAGGIGSVLFYVLRSQRPSTP